MCKLWTRLIFLIFSLYSLNSPFIEAKKIEPSLKEIISQLDQLKENQKELQDVIFSQLMSPVREYLSVYIFQEAKRRTFKTYNRVSFVTFSPNGFKPASRSFDNAIKTLKLQNERDKKTLGILNSKWELNPAQKLLLYVLYRNHQDCMYGEGIDLNQTEQKLKREYGESPPELLNLKHSYGSLPPNLKRLVNIAFHMTGQNNTNSIRLF